MNDCRKGLSRGRIKKELIAGIIAVILLSGVSTYLGTLLWSRLNFDALIKKNDRSLAQSIASAIAPYYAAHGSWEGIENDIARLTEPILSRDGEESISTREPEESRHWKGGVVPFVITDAGGNLVYSAFRVPVDASKPSGGVRIVCDGNTVGYVYFKSMLKQSYNPHEAAFISSLGLSIGISSLIGVILALALGSLFAVRFVRPIVALDEAVRKIADGETGVRAVPTGNDEIGNLARNFNAMAERIEMTERARRNLLADIAHELRTPVSVIQANLEMVIDGVYSPDRERLESLYEETRILAGLIGDLRDISDLESGTVPLNPHPVRAFPILAETREKCLPIFAEREILVVLEPSDSGGRESALVSSDENRLRQVFRNILINAHKYSLPHTTVRVAYGVAGAAGSEFFRVSIADEGPGVPESDLEKIFERFYRVDSSRNRDSGGRGLGLAICRQFVEASGGRIYARNRLPHGLEVIVELPLCQEGA